MIGIQEEEEEEEEKYINHRSLTHWSFSRFLLLFLI